MSTRMYRSFRAMWEGWTKNLVLLFRDPFNLAFRRTEEFLLIFTGLVGGLGAIFHAHRMIGWIALGLGLVIYGNFLNRIRRAHFPLPLNLLAILGLPLFAILLLRSWFHSSVKGAVTWKGRRYSNSEAKPAADSSDSQAI